MFSGMWIRVGFQPEPQLTFCYMAVSVKPGSMAMFHSVASSWKLIAKTRLHYSTHALL